MGFRGPVSDRTDSESAEPAQSSASAEPLGLEQGTSPRNHAEGAPNGVASSRRTLKASDERYRLLAENAHDVIWTVGPDRRFSYLSPSVERVLGYPMHEALQLKLEDLLTPESRLKAGAYLKHIFDVTSAGGPCPSVVIEYQNLRKDGSHVWVESSLTGLYDTAGEFNGILGVTRDITARRQAQDALKASEERYRLLAENASDVIWTMTLDHHFSYVSPSVVRLRGYTAEEAMGQTLEEVMAPSSLAKIRAELQRTDEIIRGGGRVPSVVGEFEQRRKDGTTVWVEMSSSGLYDAEDRLVGILGVARDLTERRKFQEHLAHLAHHDALTGLPNRTLFSAHLDRAMAGAKRAKGNLALLFLDLDRFKDVNDTHGHAVGDVLLQEAARRIRTTLRASDTVGRIGGDEFVVLLPDVTRAQDALLVAENLRRALGAPYEIEGKRLVVCASMGVSLYPEHGQDEVTLASHADQAMYLAKGAGRDNVRLYRAERVPSAGEPGPV